MTGQQLMENTQFDIKKIYKTMSMQSDKSESEFEGTEKQRLRD